MSSTIELSSAEQQAYETITTEDELHQSEFWKRLDVSSRKGSRLAKSLAGYGLIERTQSTHNGRTTYLLTPSEDEKTAVTTGTPDPPQTDTVETEGDLTPVSNRRSISSGKPRDCIKASCGKSWT